VADVEAHLEHRMVADWATLSVLADGGLRTGQVVGSPNAKGENPKDRPLTPSDLWGTMFCTLASITRTLHFSTPVAGRWPFSLRASQLRISC